MISNTCQLYYIIIHALKNSLISFIIFTVPKNWSHCTIILPFAKPKFNVQSVIHWQRVPISVPVWNDEVTLELHAIPPSRTRWSCPDSEFCKATRQHSLTSSVFMAEHVFLKSALPYSNFYLQPFNDILNGVINLTLVQRFVNSLCPLSSSSFRHFLLIFIVLQLLLVLFFIATFCMISIFWTVSPSLFWRSIIVPFIS